jgi:hypothetical protein
VAFCLNQIKFLATTSLLYKGFTTKLVVIFLNKIALYNTINILVIGQLAEV